MCLYIPIPPCPPEGVAESEDEEEEAVGTCPERGGVEMSWSHVQFYISNNMSILLALTHRNMHMCAHTWKHTCTHTHG